MSELASYSGKKILVTGAAGYIGTLLLSRLSKVRCEVTALMREGKTLPDFGAQAQFQCRPLVGDLRDPGAWTDWVRGQDVIFHLGGQTSHYVANEDPIRDWEANVAPMIRLGRACAEAGVKPRVIFASTATVVGLKSQFPVNETVLPEPVTVYDIHKLASENYVGYYSRLGQLEGVSLRLANVYGPGIATSHSDRGVLTIMAKKALTTGELQIFGSGDWMRDYIHVNDVVSAFLAAGSAEAAKVSAHVFNIAGGQGTRFKDVVGWIAEAAESRTGKKVSIRHVDPPKHSAIDERSYVADTRAFRAATGWSPTIGVREGVEALVRSVGEHGGSSR
ncbi:MAG: NAD-dependent epimerase/dehydratase family protein [Bdellovibrionota bacterium]